MFEKMSKLWNVFSGEYILDINGIVIGSYDEASALCSYDGSSQANTLALGKTRSANRHELSSSFRRSKRCLLSSWKMGSNISSHSGKGLSGRRAQSSGSLYRMLAPRVGRVLNPCGDGVRHRDRNKFCGSLPNHLDEKQISSRSSSSESLYRTGSKYAEIYSLAKAMNVSFPLRGQSDQAGGDQGYGSEWSPEEDLSVTTSTFHRYSTVRRCSQVPFITKENTFETRLVKGSRGLGLSVTGGIDSSDQHPGLIRIKRIFPHQPAWECGALELGDIILEANGTPLTGLTNHEALEVLRMTPCNVVLKICRPPCDALYIPVPAGEPPPPPKRDANRNVFLSSQSSNQSTKLPAALTEPCGEFDVILNKVNGSLGFTLRKEDESILGHYVRALVREPAISDGRIRPGDKIVLVNGKDISSMSHEEAVAFLRQSDQEVKLRLFRDPAQTPVSALSPTESHKTFRPKPVLRKEAIDMLSTLAVRRLSPSDSSSSGSRTRLKSNSPASSPRRRKLLKTPYQSELSDTTSNDPESAFSDKMENSGKVSAEDEECYLEENLEPASMPPMPVSETKFKHDNPLYQSAHPALGVEAEAGKERPLDPELCNSLFREEGGSQGLLKWKGIVFTPAQKEIENKKKELSENEEILTVELYRGWNSRLGFSLQNADAKTLISAIYPDSVAAKDGRLQSGDEVIMINDESVNGMTTNDVIDLLRKARGSIAITVIRSKKQETQMGK